MRDMQNMRGTQKVKPKRNIGKIIGVLVLIIIIGGVWLWYKGTKNPWHCENGVWITDKETNISEPTEVCPGAEEQQIVSDERKKPEPELLEIDSKKNAEGINIRISSPYVNATIKSPLKITGEAKDWYIDDSFEIMLLDENGNTMATGIAKAVEDVEDNVYIKFEAELEFDAQEIEAGDLIFQKSAEAESPGSFSFPVFFK